MSALSRRSGRKILNLSGTGGELVAAVDNKVITVIALYGELGGTSPTLTLKSGGSGGTALSGTLESSPIALQHAECGWAVTVEGENLFAVLAGTTPTFKGILIYTQE